MIIASIIFVAGVDALTDHRGVDVVLDCVAGRFGEKALAVTCGATAGGQPINDLSAICSKQLRIYGSTLGSREEFVRYLVFCRFPEYGRLSTAFPSRRCRRRTGTHGSGSAVLQDYFVDVGLNQDEAMNSVVHHSEPVWVGSRLV